MRIRIIQEDLAAVVGGLTLEGNLLWPRGTKWQHFTSLTEHFAAVTGHWQFYLAIGWMLVGCVRARRSSYMWTLGQLPLYKAAWQAWSGKPPVQIICLPFLTDLSILSRSSVAHSVKEWLRLVVPYDISKFQANDACKQWRLVPFWWAWAWPLTPQDPCMTPQTTLSDSHICLLNTVTS